MARCPTCGGEIDETDVPWLDTTTNIVTRYGEYAALTHTQALVFAVLLERRPGLVSHEAMRGMLGGDHEAISPNNLDVVVHRMREKLAPLYIGIKTHWGRGHQMVFFG